MEKIGFILALIGVVCFIGISIIGGVALYYKMQIFKVEWKIRRKQLTGR